MYVPCEGEALIVQDIGPELTARWKACQEMAYTAREMDMKVKLEMLRLPSAITTKMEQLVTKNRGKHMVKKISSMVEGLMVSVGSQAMQEALALMPQDLVERIAKSIRTDRRSEALRVLFWTDLEDALIPDCHYNLGVREYTQDGQEKIALVRLSVEEPKTTDGFLSTLFGEQEDGQDD